MSTTIIVGIIVVIAHLISAIAKESAKRRERERVRQEAERRKIATGTATPPTPMIATAGPPASVTSVPGPIIPEPIRSGRPVDPLIAQRQSQLEQIRARRTAEV